MGEKSKLNIKKKAIITTIVSIIAVLVLGIATGATTKILVDGPGNQVNTSASATVNNDEKEKLEQEKQAKLEEEKRMQEEEEAKRLEEEERLKAEEEAKKAEETEKEQKDNNSKKQEEEKKKEENKTTVNSAPANNGYPYYIKVNYSANTVTIYSKDSSGYYSVPIKAMACSTGAATPHSGVYKTPSKARWGVLIGPVWGQYCTRITGQILFHSVPYLKQNDPSTLEYWEYDRLGTTRSMGCIRLTVADAKWIYDNCPVGTSVEFYSSSNPGPLGKPSTQKISGAGDPYRGWDPTDPNPNNPWITKKAKEAEEAAAKAKAEAEAKKKAEEEAAAKKKAEEEAAAKKKAEEEAAAKKKAEEEANKVTVPNVVGKTEAEAKNLLKDFNVTVKYDETATKNNGLVSHQSVTSSSKVAKGTAIIITVNKVKANNTTNTTNTNTTGNNNGGNNAGNNTAGGNKTGNNTASGNTTGGNTTNSTNKTN